MDTGDGLGHSNRASQSTTTSMALAVTRALRCDAVGGKVIEAARLMFDDVEGGPRFARLVYDSLWARNRRMLTFIAPDLTIDVAVTGGQRWRIDGSIDSGDIFDVRIRSPLAVRAMLVDGKRRFSLAGVRPGPLALAVDVITAGAARSVNTSWVDLRR